MLAWNNCLKQTLFFVFTYGLFEVVVENDVLWGMQVLRHWSYVLTG